MVPYMNSSYVSLRDVNELYTGLLVAAYCSCMAPTYHKRGSDKFFSHIKGKDLSRLICKGDQVLYNTPSEDGLENDVM